MAYYGYLAHDDPAPPVARSWADRLEACGHPVYQYGGGENIASGYPTDIEPCIKLKIPVIWVNRHGEELEPGTKKPDAEVKSFRDAGKLLKAA